MRRREFLGVLGSAAAAWPLAVARSSPSVYAASAYSCPQPADNSQFQPWVGAFLQHWGNRAGIIGRNVRIDTRWATADADAIRRHAAELVALAPDAILAHGNSTVGPVLQTTRTVPIVFPAAIDPVGAASDSLARPGGNATGFMSYEFSLSGKWLELLKQIAPGVTQAAILRNPDMAIGPALFGVINGGTVTQGRGQSGQQVIE